MLTCSKLGIELPDKKDLMSVRASLGLCSGTSWPAPLTETKVSPAYSCVHPPTCSTDYVNSEEYYLHSENRLYFLHRMIHKKKSSIARSIIYLSFIVPGMPRCYSWKLKRIDAVSGGCNWDNGICITTVAWKNKQDQSHIRLPVTLKS